MKRLVCLLCAFLLVTTMFGCFAFADECEHTYYYTDVYRERWSTTYTTHTQVYERQSSCSKCGATSWTVVKTVVPMTSHTLTVTSNWHNSNNATHSYALYCPTCGYSRTETRSCDGPPCMSYMSLPGVPGLISGAFSAVCIPE